MASQAGTFNVQEFADAGLPLVSGRLYTYAYGTTTQKTAYTDAAGLVPHTYTSDGAGGQYIALNSRGELPASLYLGTGDYDLTLKRADGSSVWTRRATGVGTEFTASGGSALVGFIQAGTGAVARTAQDKMREWVTVKDFGAVGDGVADDTTAFRNATATGLRVMIPEGTYLLTDFVSCATKGQIFRGAGRSKSIVKVTSSFNLTRQGVFVASSGECGPQFEDFAVEFTQPDTATRASLTAFPPAFYLQATPRFKMARLRIAGAMTGVDMKGNSGGASLDDLEIAAFNIAVDIDGSFDSIRLSKVHCWNFGISGSGMTTNQTTIYRDGSTVGFKVGRADDIHIHDCLFIMKGKQLWLTDSGLGPAFGVVSDTDFDTYGSVYCTAVAEITFTGCFFSIGDAAVQALQQSNGYLKFTGCEFEAAVSTTNSLLAMSGTNGGADAANLLQISNCLFRITGDMTTITAAATSGVSNLQLVGNVFYATANSSPAKPIVSVAAGGRITATGNRVSDKGTGTGTFLTVASDDHHVICNNAPTGWAISLPYPLTNAIAMGNGPNTGADSWNDYATTLSANAGTFTTASATMRYKQLDTKTLLVEFLVNITANGTASGNIKLTLPKNANATAVGAAREYAVSGALCGATVTVTTNQLIVTKYDNTYAGSNGAQISGTLVYECQ